jgi:pyruvate dehydrogenase E2 component (dihydrolipoamide acetyltransferase)
MATSEAVPLVVPQMGVVEEVVVIEWLASDGDQVSEGQKVVLVETDKADTELPAPASGRLEILVPAGEDEIPVGTTLARIG